MAESRDGIGRISGLGGGYEILRQVLGLDGGARQSAPAAARFNAALPTASKAPRGQRILSPDFPLDQLDRMARRGTYIDILV